MCIRFHLHRKASERVTLKQNLTKKLVRPAVSKKNCKENGDPEIFSLFPMYSLNVKLKKIYSTE